MESLVYDSLGDIKFRLNSPKKMKGAINFARCEVIDVIHNVWSPVGLKELKITNNKKLLNKYQYVELGNLLERKDRFGFTYFIK